MTTKIISNHKEANEGADAGNKKSIMETVIKVTSQAKALCPVAEKNGGRLRGSIMWRVPGAEGGGNGADKINESPAEYEGFVGSSVYYAPYIEFGHRTANKKKWVPAQPFLRPAIERYSKSSAVNGIIKTCNEEMGKRLKKI